MFKFAFQPYQRKFARAFVTAHGLWSVREGILIAVTHPNGILRLGEIAPLPWFGSETLSEAIDFCESIGKTFEADLHVPEHLPCCQFAFESAGISLSDEDQAWPIGNLMTNLSLKLDTKLDAKSNLLHRSQSQSIDREIAALLPSGIQALGEWQSLYETGSRTFKWKIGVLDVNTELSIFNQLCQILPHDVKLRLDANAGLNLSQAQQWLEECDRYSQVEYLEQPLGIHNFDGMMELSRNYQTQIALDESIATYQQLEDCYHQGWRGIFVVKPAIAGAPSQLRKFCQSHNLDLVFSSVFETAIGRDASLQLAQDVSENRLQGIGRDDRTIAKPRALGYGTDRFFDPTLGASIGILEKDTGSFLVKFWQAIAENRPIFLGNPDWGQSNRDRFEQLLQAEPHSPRLTDRLPIYIPTGGTSGTLKFATHTWETLRASVVGMQQHFQVDQIHSCCTLPLYHVSGLMQYVRSHLTQGHFVTWDWKQLEQGHFPDVDLQSFFLSLVPTQLQRLIHQPKLKQFYAILLGGAPAWNPLLTIAREQQLPIALTYGMTETASQVTTLLPHEFLAGQTNAGKPLPHIRLQILPTESPPGSSHPIGPIQIQAQSQMLGYYPNLAEIVPTNIRSDSSSDPSFAQDSDQDFDQDFDQGFDQGSNSGFQPDDLGYLDAAGYLHLVGRNSEKIITGGENVYPGEVEALIRSMGGVQDVCVLGWPDAVWGERVVAVYVAVDGFDARFTLKENWTGSPHQYPKQWIALPQLPRNAQGKLDRPQLRQQVQRQMHT